MKSLSLNRLKNLNFKIPFFTCLLCLIVYLSGTLDGFAQNYTTTGLSSKWSDKTAWTCQGGPCANNPIPSTNVNGSTITIKHSIDYMGSNPINLESRAKLIITNGASLNLASNLNVAASSSLSIDDGKISIGPGVLNNKGSINLKKAIVIKNGNVVNDAQITMLNSCFEVKSGNFVNNGSLLGEGNIKVNEGNINNYGTWSVDVDYYYTKNSTGLPGILISKSEIEERCDCILRNCDIIPGFKPTTTKSNLIIGADLESLYRFFEPGVNPNPTIYTLNADDEVLLRIVVKENNYDAVVDFLGIKGITSSDFIVDYYNIEEDKLVITVFYPITDLMDLNAKADIINQVYSASRPFQNSGLVDSQGDLAQRSRFARLGWNVGGDNIKVGVISDSYDRKSGVISGSSEAVKQNVEKGDLPGNSNPEHPKPVNVVLDYPFGPASDEGRAMLQIIHDVAPKAELFFRTGFISEGNFAAGIADLVAQDCDIIVDDLTYINAPFFRDGIVANAINDATSKGIKYFTSAGNFGQKSYEAQFVASNSNPVRHDFGGSSLQKLTLGVGQYILALQWDDDFYSLGSPTGSKNDLDIYLTDDSGAITYGFNRNNLGNDPVEIMPFTVINPTSTNIAIERIGGNNQPLKFKYVVFKAGDDNEFSAAPMLSSSTIIGHANATGAITVGAVRYDNTAEYGGNFAMQQSSSRGGFVVNGVDRKKPDITAPTGGDTTVDLGAPDFDDNNLPNFFGTSASAPHAAAVAALLMEAKQKFGVDVNNEDPNLDVRNLLTQYAIDIAGPGFDYDSGAGFVSATNSIGSFSNPIPKIINLNLENLDASFEPGEQSFELIIEGEYFVEGSKVLLRDVVLETEFVSEKQLKVIIPEFLGNPSLLVNNQPNVMTNGSDGGDSNAVTFFDPIIKDVIVKADPATRRYGEANPEFSFTATIQDSEDELSPAKLELLASFVSLSSDAVPSTNVGIAAIDVVLADDIDPGLLELYNFIPEAGILKIDKMPVLIKPSEFEPITYGDPFPEITFDYTFGDSGEQELEIDETVAEELKVHHQTSLSTLNAISLVNRLSYINAISYVNGVPYINKISLINKTFFVSQSVFSNAETVSQNRLSFVNRDSSEKLIEFGADLFSADTIANGFYSEITNAISLINGVSLINNTAKLNGLAYSNAISLVNGISFVNAVSYVNGISFVNGIALVNGEAENELLDSFDSIFVILSQEDAAASEILDLRPVNVITGKDAGTQLVIPGGLFDSNFNISYEPTQLQINKADLTITADDKTITYGDGVEGFSSTASGLVYDESLADLFPSGLNYNVACEQCSVTDEPYAISVSGTPAIDNYTITFIDGSLSVNKFPLDIKVADKSISYGQAGPLTSGLSYSETELPYEDTVATIFEPFTFTPNDGCTASETIGIFNKQQPINYDVTYTDGHLSIAKVPLKLQVADTYILQGAMTPSAFQVNAEGFKCGDLLPSTAKFIVKNLNGTVVTGILPAGQYAVTVDISSVQSLVNYNVSVTAGKLFVNPSVGCNDRIKAADICKSPASLAGYPRVKVLLRFTYTNSLSVPIYIPNGPNNILKGKAFAVNRPPELFLPGTHTFDIYTDGDNLQWEVTTYGCNSASKSATGSNANPCTDLVAGSSFEPSFRLKSEFKYFPNPVDDVFHLQFGNQEPISLKLYNEIGVLLIHRDLKATKPSKVDLDLSSLSSGLLFLEVVTTEETRVIKVVKK